MGALHYKKIMAKKENNTPPANLEEALSIISEHEKTIASLDEKNKQQAADLDELREAFNELRSSKTVAKNPEFTLNKRTFKVLTASFRHKQKVVTAEELVKNKDLQVELIGLQSGVIQEVE